MDTDLARPAVPGQSTKMSLGAMLTHSFLAAILAMVSLPTIAAAETWRGQIECAIIPGLITKPLLGDFEMSTDGTRLTYTRPVHNADSVSLSGVAETGSGTLTGNDIKLHGGATGLGYSYAATYQGRMEGARAILTGEQVWIAAKLPQPFHRDCRITLAR